MLIQLATALAVPTAASAAPAAPVPAPPAAVAAPQVTAPPAEAPQPQEQIVVQGRRDVQRRVDEFVNALTDIPRTGQISRFDWAVCPKAVGLTDRQNNAVAERMRAVATAVGIRVDQPSCKANVLVLVTDDAPKFVRWVRDNEPSYFEGVSPAEMEALKRGGPAAAWHTEGLLDADGREVPRDRDTGQYINSRTDVPSLMSTNSHPHFGASIVVLDSRALAGLTVVQLADYAAMRAFAKTDPTRLQKAAAPTILTLLDAPMGSAVPITMTAWDFAYLKALYGSTENRLAGQQRREMAHDMTRDLTGSPKE